MSESEPFWDWAAGSVDESIGRQFDDTQGGGFADEWGAVLDPTRQASEQTEQDLRTIGTSAGAGWLVIPDAVDAAQGSDQHTSYVPDGEEIDALTPEWFDWMADHQEEVIAVLVLGALLYLAAPALELGNTLAEGSG